MGSKSGCDACSYIPAGKSEDRKIPLEIFLRGDDAPLYGITSEDDGRGYAATVLPFQAYGTLGESLTGCKAASPVCMEKRT